MMKKLCSILSVFLIVFVLSSCKPIIVPPVDQIGEAPYFECVEDISYGIGDSFDELERDCYPTASDAEDGDLTSSIIAEGSVDLNVPGSYNITYTVTDSDGNTRSKTITVTVRELDLVYPTGFYDYKFADTELRHDFMAAAENYLMHNMYGGVPLFSNGTRSLFSSRLQLPVQEYVPLMGYGEKVATMYNDDSHVKMYDGEYGNAGEYTYRTNVSTNPKIFNQYLYDTSTDKTLMEFYIDSLYAYEFNANKDGYEVVPSMAASDPVAIDGDIGTNGKPVSTKWEVTLRDDLEWFFHPDTDQAFLDTNPDTAIEADDFVNTYKMAFDESWYRAPFWSEGCNQFISCYPVINNIDEYFDGYGDWDEVGLSVKDDGANLTIVFEFYSELSSWDVRNMLSTFTKTPINIEYYDYLHEGLLENEINPYGSDVHLIGYHGPFYIDEYIEDTVVLMKENPNYHSPEDSFFTGYSFSIIPDEGTVFNEFIEGKLESSSVSLAYASYLSDPRSKTLGSTTYRMMINGFGTEETQREQFPDGSWIPEPILSIQDFKMAMFHAIDRQYLANISNRIPTMYYFNNLYLVDPERGVSYRQTEQGLSVGEDLFPESFGYNVELSKDYFFSALDQLVSDGVYEVGTEDDWTVIDIELNNYMDSDSWTIACSYLEETFEETFQDEERFIKVNIRVQERDFPAIYYDYMMPGEFDLSVGGISGSTLDAASFLDTYSSDNRSGFTINWGFDTSNAEIEVHYEFDGESRREMWSFDAISSVLNGQVFLIDGEEATRPSAQNIEVTPTTVAFTIDQFDNAAYNNITYTIEYYHLTFGGYLELEGYIDIIPDSADVLVEGLLPFYYGPNEFEEVIYQGDYQIKVEYGYVADVEKTGSNISPWFEMASIFDVTSNSTIITQTSISLGLEVNKDDMDRAITAIDVYTNGTMDGNALVDFSDLTEVSVTGLTADTDYVLLVTFDDGNVAYLMISTIPSVVE